MSSQASSAGGQEKEVRRKLVESGAVDVMIGIRSNFFYTRTVPCELWFLDRNKPAERQDKVLMLDARNIYRKVNRKIYDFSPEQMLNIAAIIWLYRGETKRFLNVVNQHLEATYNQSLKIAEALSGFEDGLEQIAASGINTDEIKSARAEYLGAKSTLKASIEKCNAAHKSNLPTTNQAQHGARKSFEPVSESIKSAIKLIDQLFKQISKHSAVHSGSNGNGVNRASAKLTKQLDEARRQAVEQLKEANYFFKQVCWLQDRFPDARLIDVPGVVKLVELSEIEAADWSLTPGRYVGVAAAAIDEDFDFEQTMSEIRSELCELNSDAFKLAAGIENAFNELGL